MGERRDVIHNVFVTHNVSTTSFENLDSLYIGDYCYFNNRKKIFGVIFTQNFYSPFKDVIFMKRIGFIVLTVFVIALSACTKEKTFVYKDGTYRAEEAEFSHGYKAFMDAEISGDKLVTVNFDYVDSTGNFKSQTTPETYGMDPHPSSWLPTYETQLMECTLAPEFGGIDGVTGATHGKTSANNLMEAILSAAKTGDTSTQVIPVE